jgi:hypothetical protein
MDENTTTDLAIDSNTKVRTLQGRFVVSVCPWRSAPSYVEV